jgi:hypothetical protein
MNAAKPTTRGLRSVTKSHRIPASISNRPKHAVAQAYAPTYRDILPTDNEVLRAADKHAILSDLEPACSGLEEKSSSSASVIIVYMSLLNFPKIRTMILLEYKSIVGSWIHRLPASTLVLDGRHTLPPPEPEAMVA